MSRKTRSMIRPRMGKNFTNVIATKDPSSPVVSYYPRTLIASSFPHIHRVKCVPSMCAFLGRVLMTWTVALDPLLDKRQQRLENGEEDDEDVAETTLQLVFFDGEEAFKTGQRQIPYTVLTPGAEMATTYINPNTKRRLLPSAITELATIEHLILLDLLGAPQPRIHSSFIDTAWLFDAMASAEQRLAENGG
ncbi:Glutaminyl-peptide cyclotransferase-like protein [Grifola frondosa]|uniref:Glutaminyl-peptide cyclotransferase-like protein n=1 Tax=Grifola frondosa TaxID=5627 RepID=A0A1C7LM07_GRIFR|nr:Glutaminyl-peptide cyclotransferase-like protein [Grifola frondosa]